MSTTEGIFKFLVLLRGLFAVVDSEDLSLSNFFVRRGFPAVDVGVLVLTAACGIGDGCTTVQFLCQNDHLPIPRFLTSHSV